MRFCGRVRPAAASDAADVARLYIVSWNEGFGHLLGMREPSPGEGDRWKGELTSGRARWWVAETGRRVAGFAGICSSRDPLETGLGELDTIAVAPGDWRTGVGRALMTVALDALRGAGYAEAILWTPAGYQRGHGFYRATGWLPDGGRRDGGRQVSFRQSLTTAPSSKSFGVAAMQDPAEPGAPHHPGQPADTTVTGCRRWSQALAASAPCLVA